MQQSPASSINHFNLEEVNLKINQIQQKKVARAKNTLIWFMSSRWLYPITSEVEVL